MTYESRLLAGILLIVLPTVMIGGVSILSLLVGDPTYKVMVRALFRDDFFGEREWGNGQISNAARAAPSEHQRKFLEC